MVCRRWVPLATIALALLPADRARAQVKPKIMIVFDTSGSMLRTDTPKVYGGPCAQQTCNAGLSCFNTTGPYPECWTKNASNEAVIGGDGSEQCAALGTSTRLFQLKSALFDVLQGMGNSEIDFALSTYPMMMDPMRTPKCPTVCVDAPTYYCSGHYYVVPGQNSEYGWVPHACKISSHLRCGSDADCGAGGKCCISANPAQCPTQYVCNTPHPIQLNAQCSVAPNCPWYADYKKEVLKVPFGQPIENVLLYVDEKEDPGPVAALTNPEVRAAFNWFTPLGKSLFYTHGYLDKEIALPDTDYRKACEKLVVAFFTDGEETCNSNVTDPFYPSTWAQKLAQNAHLKATTHLVAIDVSSTNPNECSANLKAIAQAGGGSCYPVKGDSAALKAAFLDIIAKSQPPVEVCNNKDDDCDNAVDEDFPQKSKPCDNGLVGACYRAGTYVCKGDGSGVVCSAQPVIGTGEKCNGIDDDCNGLIDDLPGCTPCVPQPEICNNKDDDCDGIPDNGIPSVPCGVDVGVCKAGTSKCVAGKTICEGGNLGGPELCDGQDNDCDGIRDGMSSICYEFDSAFDPASGALIKGCDKKTGKCLGLCTVGTSVCTAVQDAAAPGGWKGVQSECLGDKGPEKEICNGLDDDCNDKIDDGAECPGGGQCINGACTRECKGEVFSCPTGQLCKNGWCVADPCDAAQCEKDHPGWVCQAGQCVDACASKQCDPGFLCKKGICEDQSCYGVNKCPAGQECIQGVCKSDPCADAATRCPPTTFCLAGTCVPLCETVNCAPDEVCKVVQSGTGWTTGCVKDSCATIRCSEGSICKDRRCIPDPCASITCTRGTVCVDGKCENDLCEEVRCLGDGYVCKAGQCIRPTVEGTTNILATGGGASACNLGDLGGGPASGLPTFLLVLGLILCALGRRTWRD